MKLLPIEQDRLLVFLAAELARRRRSRGLLLSYPEAVALIADEMHEAARGGASYDEVTAAGAAVLTESDVMGGVASLTPSVRVECLFEDGLRLVVVNAPIKAGEGHNRAEATVAGSRTLGERDVELYSGRQAVPVDVTNASPAVIWVGSHFPFFEVNKRLRFNRRLAWGRHLDIPAGDTVRFGPLETTSVTLVDFTGHRIIRGFNGLTDGEASPERLAASLLRAQRAGFADPEEDA